MCNIKFDYVNSKCQFETLQILVGNESKWDGWLNLYADNPGRESLQLDKQIIIDKIRPVGM